MSPLATSFEILVSYYQIAVNDSTMERPWNDWRTEHVRQGFVWRPRSVSFGTTDILMTKVDVRVAPSVELSSNTIRAIRVPFTVLPSSELEVAVVAFEHPINVPPGEYALTYEHGICESGDKMWCVLTFVPDPAAEPAVLIADPELSPPTPLLMEANPA